MHEKWVWVFSGVLFGLLHLPNVFFGQSLPHRSSRWSSPSRSGDVLRDPPAHRHPVVTMGLHAIWDFSVFIQDHSGLNLEDKPVAAGGFVLYVTHHPRHHRTREDPQDR